MNVAQSGLPAAAVLILACATGARSSGGGGGANAPALVTEEIRIPARDPGIELYLRNKHLSGPPPARALLLVHGATSPAETSFDLPLGGLSWMDFIAQRGFDVWLVDVRGYGRSTRPPEMDQPPDRNPAIVRTDTALRDVSTAVDYVVQRRGLQKVALLGWSWGTILTGSYAAAHPDKVERLVLYGPIWLLKTPPAISGKGAYRSVTVTMAREGWFRGVAEANKKELVPDGWFEQWVEATFATDPVGSQQNPKVLRAPNGVVADMTDFWSQDKPLYDPGQIRAPTLLIRAQWDVYAPAYMSEGLFEKLDGAPWKRYVEIGEGTHTVMMEKNRMQLFREVQAFLEEPEPLQPSVAPR